MERITTDNVNVEHKLQLRREAVSKLSSIRCLDLFAGNNVLWSHFATEKYFGVEKVKGKGKNLNADNLKVIQNLDLSKFNVIDVDSYGIPVKQMDLLFRNPTLQNGTIIIYTCIGSALSGFPKIFLEKYGFYEMYKKCKVLFNIKTNDLFHAWLFDNGIKKVREYEEPGNGYIKKYGYFTVE